MGVLPTKKNILSAIMMSMICVGIVTIQWICFGYTFAFGPGKYWGSFQFAGLQGVGGAPNPDVGGTISHLVYCFFQLMFAIITPALISGALLERMKFISYVIFITIWTTVVYDPVAHWIWSGFAVSTNDIHNVGWLRDLGAIDFAGGIVIHETAGLSALVATLFLGKRRYTPQKEVPSHNIPFVWVGGFLLWFGWFGFNGGSAGAINSVAIQAAFNSQVAASTGLVFWMILELIFNPNHKPTSVGAITGAIVGLACITPGSGYVTTGASLVFGVVGPGFAFLLTRFKEKLVFDDAVDVLAAHGLGGFIGAMLTGVFASTDINPGGPNGAIYGNPLQVAIQFLACVVAGALACAVTAIVFVVLKYTIGIQVTEDTEHEGLDKKYHAENAYNINGDGEHIDLHEIRNTGKFESQEDMSEEDEPSNGKKSEDKPEEIDENDDGETSTGNKSEGSS